MTKKISFLRLLIVWTLALIKAVSQKSFVSSTMMTVCWEVDQSPWKFCVSDDPEFGIKKDPTNLQELPDNLQLFDQQKPILRD